MAKIVQPNNSSPGKITEVFYINSLSRHLLSAPEMMNFTFARKRARSRLNEFGELGTAFYLADKSAQFLCVTDPGVPLRYHPRLYAAACSAGWLTAPMFRLTLEDLLYYFAW
jgi:hypothetical protein